MPRKKQQNRKKNYPKKPKVRFDQSGDKEVQKSGSPKRDIVLYKGIGIPAQFYTKLKWNYTFGMTTLPYEEVRIRANSPFDPWYNVLIGTGSALYNNELGLIYNKQCTIASTIALTFVNRTNVNEPAFCKVGVFPLADTTTAVNVREATERDNCVFAQLGPNTGDQGIIQMKSYAKNHAILGLAPDEYNDDTQSSLVFSTPTQNCLWHVFAGTLDGIAATNIYCDVTVTYYVKFYERVLVASQ